MAIEQQKIRAQFPTLNVEVNDKPLVYLDSGATALKPICVVERTNEFYQKENAAVHRGIHSLSANATDAMESVRTHIQSFIGASYREEVVFTAGTTASLNIVAHGLCNTVLNAGDEIIITDMEHHANIVPWQTYAKRHQLTVRILYSDTNGELDLNELKGLISEKTKVISVAHVSNVLGTINPVEDICQLCRQQGIISVVDGAQAIVHQAVDVSDLGCDFYAFSAHKLYGPTGIGVLYGRKDQLDALPPFETGGAMISQVDLEDGTTFNDIPWRFEAGTPNVAGIIGFGEALKFVEELGLDEIAEYDNDLIEYAYQKLSSTQGVTIYGPAKRAGVISFNLNDIHAFDVGSFLDKYGIAIRTGHHCAMPLMKKYGVSSMCRASFAVYNTKEEVDLLVEKLERIRLFFE